jgi:hypothetical protein
VKTPRSPINLEAGHKDGLVYLNHSGTDLIPSHHTALSPEAALEFALHLARVAYAAGMSQKG